MSPGLVFAAALLAVCATGASALELTDDLTVTGYGDVRVVAPSGSAPYLNGGLGKFRYGNGDVRARFAEAVAQIDWRITDEFAAVGVARVEPFTPSVVDALEAYVRYAPRSEGALSISAKAGVFFPAISLENDDLGWASPYTLTPSAIDSWVGDELRTIGSEATVRWKTDGLGTVSLLGA